MAKLVDALALGASVRKDVGVRVPSCAEKPYSVRGTFFCGRMWGREPWFDHKSLRSKAFEGSFAKQRAERSECRDEHHCASEFNPLLRRKTVLRKGYGFFVKKMDTIPLTELLVVLKYFQDCKI